MQYNLLNLTESLRDYSHLKVRVPLSAGINSAAVLCLLCDYPEQLKPKELHLYYAHFIEHSPDSDQFVMDLFSYARKHFHLVNFYRTVNSVNQFFIEQKMIPHPSISPCSRELKIVPMQQYDELHGIDVVLIGYVEEEIRRYKRSIAYKIYEYDKSATVKQLMKMKLSRLEILFSQCGDKIRTKDEYPLLRITNEDCFTIVKEHIGWYPKIYDIREKGKRVFNHNNCLPCKNMHSPQFQSVGRYYPEYAQDAIDTQEQVPDGYWGRDDVPDVFKCDLCERFG